MTDTIWSKKKAMHVFLFNVGRGLSVFIRTPLNHAIVYDFGAKFDENGEKIFSPVEFIEKNLLPHISLYGTRHIAQTIISHPHADHLSELQRLFDDGKQMPFGKFYSDLHTCPNDQTKKAPGDPNDYNEKFDFDRIISDDNKDLITMYRDIYRDRCLPLQTIQHQSNSSDYDFEYGIFYIAPPKINDFSGEDNQIYTNSSSIVSFFRHGKNTLLLPGDMHPKGMEYMLKKNAVYERKFTSFNKNYLANCRDWYRYTSNQPTLKELLNKYGLSVLVAPHHGLKDTSYSADLYREIKGGKPNLVLISEKRLKGNGTGDIDPLYQNEDTATGLNIYIEGKMQIKKNMTTKNGHHFLMVFNEGDSAPEIYAEKYPEKLLKYL